MSAHTNFQVTGCNISEKSTIFTFSHRKAQVTKFDLAVIIYINFVELESPMLHAKFQDHRTSGSGEEGYLRFLPYMGMAAILVM